MEANTNMIDGILNNLPEQKQEPGDFREPEVFPVDCKRGLCIRGRSGTDSGCSRLDSGGNPAAGNHWKCGECD